MRRTRERALGANAGVVLDRPDRELGCEQQQHADHRRPAVDDVLVGPPADVTAAGDEDRPGNERGQRSTIATASSPKPSAPTPSVTGASRPPLATP